MEPAWRKKQLFCYQLLWVGPLVANTIWRHDEGFHLSISDSAQHVGMHRLLLQAQSSFLDGNHKKCEIICQLYIFFWSLPVVDQEKNLNILLYSDLNVPGELRWWLILYWPLVSDMLVVVSYYGSQPLNQACNLLIDSPVSKSTETSNVRHGKHMALAGRKYKKQKIQLRGLTSYEKVTTVKSSHPICHVKGNMSQRKSSLRWVFTMQKLAAKLVFQLLALHQQRAPSCRGSKESHTTMHRVPFKH